MTCFLFTPELPIFGCHLRPCARTSDLWVLPKISSPAMMFLIFALVPGPEATPQAIQSFNKPRRTNPERERRMRALAFRVRLCQVSALALNGGGNHTPGEAVLH